MPHHEGQAKASRMKFYAHVGRPRPTRLDFKAVPLKAAHGHFAMLLHSKNSPDFRRGCFSLFFSAHGRPPYAQQQCRKKQETANGSQAEAT